MVRIKTHSIAIALFIGGFLLSACAPKTAVIVMAPQDLKSANAVRGQAIVAPGIQKKITICQLSEKNLGWIQAGNAVVTVSRHKRQTIFVTSATGKNSSIKPLQRKKNIHPVLNQPVILHPKRKPQKSAQEKPMPDKMAGTKNQSITGPAYHFSFISHLLQSRQSQVTEKMETAAEVPKPAAPAFHEKEIKISPPEAAGGAAEKNLMETTHTEALTKPPMSVISPPINTPETRKPPQVSLPLKEKPEEKSEEKPDLHQSALQSTAQTQALTPPVSIPGRFLQLAAAMVVPQAEKKLEEVPLPDQSITMADEKNSAASAQPVAVKPETPSSAMNQELLVQKMPIAPSTKTIDRKISFARNPKIILNHPTPFEISHSPDLLRMAEQKKLNEANKNWRLNTIMIHQPILIAWRQVGHGLTMAGYTIMYRDPYLTSYYVADRTRTHGLYHRNTPVFRVKLYPLGDTTLVTMYDAKGNYVVEDDLKRLYRTLP